jgi:hypothetical protein
MLPDFSRCLYRPEYGSTTGGASDEPLVQLHNMALVIAATTREMLATKYLAQSNAERLDRAALVVQNLTRRVTAVEQQVRAGKLTEEQAAEIKRRVNLIAVSPVS